MAADVNSDSNERVRAEQRAAEAAARLTALVSECVDAMARRGPGRDTRREARRDTPPHLAALPDDARSALRDGIQEYASALRSLEATPEHMLIRVKRLAADALDRAQASSPELMQTIATWSIEGYFSGTGRAAS